MAQEPQNPLPGWIQETAGELGLWFKGLKIPGEESLLLHIKKLQLPKKSVMKQQNNRASYFSGLILPREVAGLKNPLVIWNFAL